MYQAMTDRRWAVGNVKTGDEIGIAARLEGDGLQTYCPRFEKPVRRAWHQRKRKRETVVKAVFPGYLFVNAETIRDMEAVYETPGFHYFLRNDGCLSLLSDSVIEGLRALEGRGVLVATQIRELVAQYLPGDIVRVDGGPFGGMIGEVASQDKDRVVLMGYDFSIPSVMPAQNLKLSSG